MGCGIEDRNITDRYEAMQYGWDEAISRVSECLPDVLFTAPPSKQEPDYGIDRGAWSDVPDATKWVDELRGDEDLDEPPNSTTDVVEPVAWMYVNKDGEVGDIGYGVGVFTRKDPDIKLLYEAPPRREWVGLTDEELSAIWGEFGLALMPVRKAIASDIEAKLKEKNRD
jgi:hypothetical protein